MLNMMGNIDDIHIAIARSSYAFVEDYFHHKTRGYNIVAQMVVDNQKTFIDVYVRLLGSVNDCHVLSLGCIIVHYMEDFLIWLQVHKIDCCFIYLEIRATQYFFGS